MVKRTHQAPPKKWLTRMLLMTIAILACSYSANAAKITFTVGNFEYFNADSETHEAEVLHYIGSPTSSTFTFPSSVTYNGITYTVVNAYGTFGFDDNSVVKTIVIPATFKNFDLCCIQQFPLLQRLKLNQGAHIIRPLTVCYIPRMAPNCSRPQEEYQDPLPFHLPYISSLIAHSHLAVLI